LHPLDSWGNVAQIGYVVKDLQKTIEAYWHKYGIGPWHIYDCTYPEHQNTYVRGEPKPYSMRIAFAHLGDTELELIQPLAGDSIYQEFLDSGREGIHHIGMKGVDGPSALARLKTLGCAGFTNRNVEPRQEALFLYGYGGGFRRHTGIL
jgi:hypothetical protein